MSRGRVSSGREGEKRGARLTSCKCESSSAASSAASGIIVFGGGGYAGLGWLPILGRGVARVSSTSVRANTRGRPVRPDREGSLLPFGLHVARPLAGKQRGRWQIDRQRFSYRNG